MQSAGQVCLVTGGAHGIGWAMTRLLAEHGAEVHVIDISQEKLDAAARAAEGHSWARRIRMTSCDVTDRRAVEDWVEGAYAGSGRIDVLINNAAFAHWATVADMTPEDAQRVMRVGFEGTILCTHYVLPKMLLARQGHIVNMGSVAGRMYLFGGTAAYSASKAAIEAYTRILQIELRDSGIHVTLVRPGPVEGTDVYRSLLKSPLLPRIFDWLPLVSPDQVANAVRRILHTPKSVLTIPWQFHVLDWAYHFSPRLSRWLCRLGLDRKNGRPRFDNKREQVP